MKRKALFIILAGLSLFLIIVFVWNRINVTQSNEVSCGGWNTFEQVVCECSGQLEKSTCQANAVCDGGIDTCYGTCGECKCYRGSSSDGVEFPCDGRDEYFK